MQKRSAEKTVQISTTILQKDYESLQKLSATTNIPMAEIVRNYILDGLKVSKNKDDIDFIRKQIREELNSVVGYHIERIIKLIYKIGTMTVTMCFFNYKVLYLFMSAFKGKVDGDFQTVFKDAQKQAGSYLRMKSSEIDEVTKDYLNK